MGVLRAVCFDLDGTLFDHRGSARAGATHFLESLKVAAAESALDSWFAAEDEQFERWRSGQISFQEQRRERLRTAQPSLGCQWGIRVASPERVVISDSNAPAWVRSGDQRLLLKWSVAPDRFERLALAAKLTAWLGALGLPVSAPVPTLSGEVQVTSDGVSMGLQRVIDGDHLNVEDADQVRVAGATIARLHDALRAHPVDNSQSEVLSVPAPLTKQIAGWVASDPSTLPPGARGVLGQLLERVPSDLPPVQIV